MRKWSCTALYCNILQKIPNVDFDLRSWTQESHYESFPFLSFRKRSVSEMQLMHNLGEHRHTVERQDWLQMKLQDVHSALEDARTHRPRNKEDIVLGEIRNRRLLPEHLRAAVQKKSIDLDKAYMNVLFKTKPWWKDQEHYNCPSKHMSVDHWPVRAFYLFFFLTQTMIRIKGSMPDCSPTEMGISQLNSKVYL